MKVYGCGEKNTLKVAAVEKLKETKQKKTLSALSDELRREVKTIPVVFDLLWFVAPFQRISTPVATCSEIKISVIVSFIVALQLSAGPKRLFTATHFCASEPLVGAPYGPIAGQGSRLRILGPLEC